MSNFGYNVLGFGANASTSTGPSDDQFNRVSFLSHFEGANNGVNNVFDDGSASNHTVTANGNVTQGSFGPFARPDGEWGVSFDGDGDSLTFTNDATMSLDGDYTFELFFNARNIVLDSQHPNTVLIGSTQLFIHASSKYISWYANGGNIVHSANDAVLTNVWNHVAVVRSGTGSNNTSMYLNGTRVQQATNTATLGASSGTARIGSYTASGGNFDGHISNLRLLKGTALYSGSSITVPTSALTAITNTKLLTCQSNRFIDNSSTGFALTPVGAPAISAFGPFLTSSVYDPAVNGASAYFSASGDYLSIANSSEFFMGNDAYTIEFWNFGGPTTSVQYIFDNYKAGGTGGMTMYLTNAGKIHMRFSSTAGVYKDTITSDGAFIIDQWSHIAVVRTYVSSNTTVVIYVNGVAKATETFNNVSAVSNTSEALTISFPGQYGYIGYLCDFRMVKGTAVYTGNFTPPTAPLTAITNTKLLLNMADGQAIDSAAQNNLTLVGTAKTSTAQKLFGDASLLLDGNSDLVTFPTEAGNFGTGNFTIEFSFRLAADVGSTPNSCVAKWETSGSQRSWMIRIDNVSSANKMKFFDSADGSASTGVTFSTSFSSETWYKIAVVNVSGTVSLYVNGTADSTTHSLATGAPYASTGLVSIGANVPSNPDNFFNGNIDEVRLSKFARYTADFTAPTAAFPDKGQ